MPMHGLVVKLDEGEEENEMGGVEGKGYLGWEPLL